MAGHAGDLGEPHDAGPSGAGKGELLVEGAPLQPLGGAKTGHADTHRQVVGVRRDDLDSGPCVLPARAESDPLRCGPRPGRCDQDEQREACDEGGADALSYPPDSHGGVSLLELMDLQVRRCVCSPSKERSRGGR